MSTPLEVYGAGDAWYVRKFIGEAHHEVFLSHDGEHHYWSLDRVAAKSFESQDNAHTYASWIVQHEPETATSDKCFAGRRVAWSVACSEFETSVFTLLRSAPASPSPTSGIKPVDKVGSGDVLG